VGSVRKGGILPPDEAGFCHRTPWEEQLVFGIVQKPYKPGIIGVVGGSAVDEATLMQAEAMGKHIAGLGCVLMSGGGGGVMRAASKGAYLAGGLVIGILPNERQHPSTGYPNEYVHIPIYTGLSDARNVILAKAPNAVVAFRGTFGTMSEVALALKAGTPVISLGISHCRVLAEEPLFVSAMTVEDAVGKLRNLLESP